MATLDAASLGAIFKAYDIRGTVPDQLDAEIVERIGAAFARFAADTTGASRILVAHDMRPSGPEFAAAFARGATAQGLDVVHLGLASTDLLFFAAGHFDAPGAMLTASHNPAQYNGIKLCLAGARPVGEDTGLARDRGRHPRRARRRRRPRHDLQPRRRARRLRRARALVRRPRRAAPAEGRRRHGQRHGRPHRSGGVRRPALRTSRCSTASSTARSRTIRPTRSSPRTSSTSRPGCSRPAPTSASPSTATPTACSSSTTRASSCRARSPRRSWPTRMLRKYPGQTVLYNLICSKAVPEVIARGGGHGRAHPGRSLVHQAGHGRDRRLLRWRALGSLLLPRQLPGRLRHHRRARSCSRLVSIAGVPLSELRKPYERYAASGEINTEVPDPTGRDRSRRRPLRRTPSRTASTASPSRSPRTTRPGGSTSARPTPSPCCGSTSRPPTARRAIARRRGPGSHRRRGRPGLSSTPPRSTDGARPAAARDPGLSRGQGPAALLRRRGRALQPAPEAALRRPRRHPDHAGRRGRRRSTTPSTSACWPRPRPRASARRSRPERDRSTPLGMFDAVAALPEQLTVAAAAAATVLGGLALPAHEDIANVVVLGMGGRRSGRRRRCSRSPARSCRCRWSCTSGYGMPNFVDDSTLVWRSRSR